MADKPETSGMPDSSEVSEAEPGSPHTMTDPTVSVEAEPATGTGTTPEPEQQSAATSNANEQRAVDDHSATTPDQAPQKDIKRTAILAIVAVVVVISAAIVFWLALKPAGTETRQSSVTTPVEQPKLGVVASVGDGRAEFSAGEDDWQPVTEGMQLAEGATIRTDEANMAVLTLDDGSAIRLDTQSSVRLTSLAADDVQVEQLAGNVYSRIVPSDRKYTVSIDSISYQALGTAFVTVKTETENGVQVFQNSVKASSEPQTVTEGKQYFKASEVADRAGKVTDIDIDALASSYFINWNIFVEINDDKFKDKLGVLARVKELAAEEQAKRDAIEAERLKANIEATRKAAAEYEKYEKDQKTSGTATVTRGQMSLSAQGDTLNWTYTGLAPHGYKLVYAEHDSPTFGTDKAVYFSDPRTLSAQLSKYIKKNKAYKVRVCAYTAGTESDKCVDYSNAVQVRAGS